MKPLFPEAGEVLGDLFGKVPGIRDFRISNTTSHELKGEISLYNGETISIAAHLLDRAVPKNVAEVTARCGNEKDYTIIMAPYISEASAKLCKDSGMGYCDYSGNCLICYHTLYISNQGNPNKYPAEYKPKSVFNPSAQITSRILRELLSDVSKIWKIKKLSEKVGCSIGMTSHIKTFLCEQNWAIMDSNGLRLTDPKSLLEEWSKNYSVDNMISCYTLESIPVFEDRCFRAYQEGIRLCMTGFSGGVRYAPVVRYSKAHVWIQHQDVPAFLKMTGCKEVDSGANVVLYLALGEDVFVDSREIRGSCVASPVQVFLDCMQIKGRGEEMAEAVLAKEIQK